MEKDLTKYYVNYKIKYGVDWPYNNKSLDNILNQLGCHVEMDHILHEMSYETLQRTLG